MEMVYDVSIFLVMDDKEIVQFNEIDQNDISRVRFLMITNDVLNNDYGENNTIYLSRYWKEQMRRMNPKHPKSIHILQYTIDNSYEKHSDEYTCMYWSADDVVPQGLLKYKKDDCVSDCHGQKNCNDIMRTANKILEKHNKIWKKTKVLDLDYWFEKDMHDIREIYPALMAAYNTTYTFDGIKYHGYVPSIGQLMIISKNIVQINHILESIGGHETMLPSRIYKGKIVLYDGITDIGYNSGWWSSTYADDKTMFDDVNLWILSGGIIRSASVQALSYRVLPLFSLNL